QSIASAVTGCGTSALRDDKLVYQISMENTLNDYNLLSMSAVGPVAGISANFYELAYNANDGHLYASLTDFFSAGSVHIYDANNTLIDQFNVGVSPGTIVFDLRSSAGIKEASNNLKVYPNPSNGLFQVEGLGNAPTLWITNTAGQIVLTTNSTQIDLSKLESGIYFLNAGEHSVKLIKN
ncbi:MAG: T9SS type A sorting domain-containing protein, partial [Flavobacteriales bacterium]